MSEERVDFIPEFSGNPEDLNDFVNMILADMTLEQLARYGQNKFVSESVTTPSGYILPPTAQGGGEGVGGVDTSFPLSSGIAQSFNTDLAKQIGNVIAVEKRATIPSTDPNNLIHTGVSDMRIIPLNGRIYEGYSEDSFLSNEMLDSGGQGYLGDDGFYIQVLFGTKHYSTYTCEWDRLTKTYYINNRSLHEYQEKGVRGAFKNNHIPGCMTSFAAINGVPNVYSPYARALDDVSPYTPFKYSDYDADGNTLNDLGNGFDSAYARTGEQVAAMLIKAGCYTGMQDPEVISVQDYISAVNNNLFGVTRTDLENLVRAQIEAWVRCGYFSQDTYPYTDLSSDKNPVTSSDPGHQAVAMQAAQEGFVLLKNENNILPLSKDASILITGLEADFRIPAGYEISVPDGIPNAGDAYTAVSAIMDYVGTTAEITYVPELSSDLVRYKSVSEDRYLTVTNNTIEATAIESADATIFQLYDWGQYAYSLATSDGGKILEVDGTDIIMAENNPAWVSSLLTHDTTADDQTLIRHGVFPVEILDLVAALPFYNRHSQSGNYLTVDEITKKLVLGSSVQEGYENDSLFTKEIVSEAGADASLYVNSEYALLFIGSHPYASGCEVNDRANLDFGSSQLKMVNNVASVYPGKTIVVVNSVYPMAMEELQNNPDVAAILYASTLGQFDSYALAQTLFGDNAPSGRLTNTWLKDLSTLPKLTDEQREEQQVDPMYTVFMRNADLQQLGLTYLYNDPEDATYHFGYGLSYTTFAYSNFVVTPQTAVGDNIDVSVTVTNTGTIASKEVIQIYMNMPNSRYRSYVPKRQLVGFAKTQELAAGASETVTISISPETLEKWDVTRQQFFVEGGTYQVEVGISSQNILWSQAITILGESVGEIALSEGMNLWESSYASFGARGIEVSRQRTSLFAGSYFAVESVNIGDYVIVPNVNFGGATSIEFRAASTNEISTIELYANSLDGAPLCSLTISATDPVTYYLDEGETIQVTELPYGTYIISLSGETNIVNDLYVVFGSENIRVESIRVF